MPYTYSAVGSSEKAADAPWTVTVVDKLDSNPHAIAEGAVGAPRIQTGAYDAGSVDAAAIAADAVGSSEIAAAAVAQSELKTANSDHDLSASTGTRVTDTTTSAGLYALSVAPAVGTTQGNTHHVGILNILNSDNYSFSGEGLAQQVAGGNTTQTAFRVHYVQSSPPYDLGDGEVPLFVCLAIERGSGKVVASSVAPDPVWANNGPTIIDPDGTLPDGRRFRWLDGHRREADQLIRARAALLADLRDQAGIRRDLSHKVERARTERRIILLGEAARQQRTVDRALSAKLEARDHLLNRVRIDLQQIDRRLDALKRPITMADKNADMTVIPHNYLSWDPDTYIFAYLDPCETADLWERQAAGEFLGSYIRNDLIIHNDDLVRAVPPGTRAVRFTQR